MSEEQEKKQEESLQPTKTKAAKKPKVDEVALLKEEVNNLKACLTKLATFTGYQRIVKEFNLEPYEYQANEIKRRN